ncbi:MAG TPA: sensor domain-containing diguanylate cyclase [Gallionella sp.]|nr:EAL domain-containing protein [Gallionella sp.]OGS67317.1 MAG: diguanylate cyclase [Gallionellales bacterium GWA2_54_124]HCI52127.1 sensor domain-containing diguanylate cyclase [Gallionella sp.]
MNKFLKKFHPGYSLRAQISLASATMVLLLSAAIGFYAADVSKKQIEESEGNAFELRAKNALDVLDRGMFERSREIQNAAILNEIRDPLAPVEHKREILTRLQTTFNAYAWIGICDTKGVGLVGTGQYLEGKDLSKRPWCSKGRDKTYIGDVHDALLLSKLLPNPSGEMFYLVDVAAPVLDKQGVLQGVLCGHIFWRWAEEVLDSKKTPGKDIFLISRDGTVLSGPAKPQSKLADLSPAAMQIISTNQSGGSQLVKWNDGKTYLVGFSKSSGYREYQGLGWASLVRQDVSTAFAPARQLQQHIWLVGAALGLLFAWLGWLMAGRIARPISLISQAADKVAGGELDYELPARLGEGEVAHLSTAIHDMVANLTHEIKQRKEAEQGLRLSAKVFESNTEAIMITDFEQNIVMVNQAFTDITGYGADEVLGRRPKLLSSGRHGPEFYEAFWQTLRANDLWRGEIWNKRKNGEIFPEWVTISALRDETAQISHYVAVFLDITERKKEEERINYLANYDMLTGLPNRYLLSDRIEQAFSSAQRNNFKVAVLFIDLDYFKNINDSLGHDIGDALLKLVAARLKTCLRRSDTIARLGGDEFLALLSELDSSEEVIFVAEKMIESLTEKFTLGEYQLSITPSIGICIYPDDGETSVELLRNADLAMYQAKDDGRNNFKFYSPDMNRKALERLKLETYLRVAIVQQQLSVYYQPKVNVLSGKMIGMEALLRWQHPELGFISPAVFIPIAEETGLINEIGDWVLRQSCLQARLWQAQGYDIVPIAVNLSARQLKQDNFSARVVTILREAGLDPRYLMLEITESMLMSTGESGLQILEQLRADGIRLALDDFGTGYSSLSRLKNFPLDSLKIDQSFVRDIVTDPDDASIVSATAVLAHALNLKVTAEGVETQEQLDFIRTLNCEEYQGYLFSRPIPASEVVKYFFLD